jgi:acetoin utilization deacetylase AcuC-like enzyme
MPTLEIHYADHAPLPLPPLHPFPAAKYAATRALLASDARTDCDRFVAAEPAPWDVVLLAHDADYVDRWLRGDVPESDRRASGFPWSPEMVVRSLTSVGATLGAVEAALRDGVGCSLAGGTHHAARARASGYCVFNDQAVAARLLLATGRARRVLIVDLDVHQGDGTAEIFAGDDRVFTFSMHGAKNFPRVKVPSSLDLPLPDGTDDEGFLGPLLATLPGLFDRVRPDVVLYQAGVDPLRGDRLGRLALSHDGLAARDAFVFGEARRRGVPIASSQGGGYGKMLGDTVLAHANVVRAARDVLCPGSSAGDAR